MPKNIDLLPDWERALSSAPVAGTASAIHATNRTDVVLEELASVAGCRTA